jgi:hypothetical protein
MWSAVVRDAFSQNMLHSATDAGAQAKARALYMGSEILRHKFKEGGLAKAQEWIASRSASDLIASLQPGMRDIVREMREQMAQNQKASPPDPENTVTPRSPGETPEAYLKRMGAAQ